MQIYKTKLLNPQLSRVSDMSKWENARSSVSKIWEYVNIKIAVI